MALSNSIGRILSMEHVGKSLWCCFESVTYFLKRVVRKLPYLLLILFSNNAIAQFDHLLLGQEIIGSDKNVVSYLPGEQYDPFYGVMGHYMTDLVFEGNGLPIVISRKLNIQNPNSRLPIRNAVPHFQLDIPMLTYSNNSAAGHTGTCINSRLASNRGEQYIFDSNARNTPVTFTYGKQTIHFFSTEAYELPADISRFSGRDADYVSASNWYIKCSQTIGASPLPYNDEFHVYSPDGTIYVMGKGRGIGVGQGGFTLSLGFPSPEYPTTNVAWRVTKVIDPYGNTLDYVYENNDFYGTSNGQPRLEFGFGDFVFDKLERIVANDGRMVSFTYGEGLGGANTALTKVESNGSPNKHIVEYEYADNEFPFGVVTVLQNNTYETKYEFARVGLSKITYPHGGRVDYSYERNSSNYIEGRPMREVVLWEDETFDAGLDGVYYPIESRTVTSSSGNSTTFRYGYDSLALDQFSRIVNTPERTIEYTYRKDNLVWPTGLAAYRVGVIDGKLLSVKDYGKVIPFSDPRSNPVFEKRYSYKIASTVTTAHAAKRVVDFFFLEDIPFSLQQKGTTNIVPSIVTTTTASLEFPTIKQTFTRSFEQYDSDGFGLPTLIKETSAAGKVRYISKTYKTDFSRWIKGKNTSTIVRETLNGPAINSVTLGYNQYGDVIYQSNNGIVTRTDYHESGTSKGQIKSVVDELQNTIIYSDYVRGIARQQVDQRGRRKFKHVNSDGTVRSETRLGSSAAYTYSYDNARRLSKIESPRSETTDTYIRWEGLKKKIESQGAVWDWKRETVFDDFGRDIFEGSYTYSNGKGVWLSVTKRYDMLGRKIFESYPSNLSSSSYGSPVPGTLYDYDSFGRLSRRVQQTGSTDVETRYAYRSTSTDSLRVTTIENGSTISHQDFDSYGEPSYKFIKKNVNPLNTVTNYDRDALGRILSISRDGQIRTYNYDENKNVQAEWNPENGNTRYSYYGNGWLKSKVNESEAAYYDYYPDGSYNVITREGNGESVKTEYSYDINGNLETLLNQSGGTSNTWTYTYDTEDNLLSETLDIDNKQFSLDYDYNHLSDLVKTTYPNSRQYLYSTDGLGRATGIRETDGKVIYDVIQYHPDGSMYRLKRDSLEVQSAIDNGRRIRGRRLTRSSDLKVWADRQYIYDGLSNVRTIRNDVDNQTTTLDYDVANRIKTVQLSNAENWAFEYNSHDDITQLTHGERTNTYTYDNNTFLLTRIDANNPDIPVRGFSYDSTGSMVKNDALWPESNRLRTRTFVRNSAGQITNIDDGTSTSYEYDGHGLRVKKSRNGAIYSIYDSSGKLRFREDTNGSITSEYFYIADHLIARRDTNTSNETPTIDLDDGGAIPTPVDDTVDDSNDGSAVVTPSGITVTGRTISWADTGYYQVQANNGSINVCEGGLSCTVSSAGTYIVINHTTGTRSNVVID